MTTIRMVARDGEAMAEASAWLARLQGEVSEADGLAFDAWLDAAPGNRDAYRQALSVWQAYHGREAAVLDELARVRRAPQRGVNRRWLVGGGAGAALAATLAVAMLPQILAESTTQTYQTAKGERRQVTLPDGSVIDLNAETRLTVVLARRERKVDLAEGEAIFAVAHDKERPFTVAAQARVVRVVGTQFNVRSRSGELTVTVAEGRVQVRPATETQTAHAFVLNPGQRLAVDASGAERLASVDPQETFAWRSGRLVYRDRPLAEVVGDLNRQFETQIEIGDPELSDIPITGVIVLDDAHSVADRLALMLPVRSVPSERGLLLKKK